MSIFLVTFKPETSKIHRIYAAGRNQFLLIYVTPNILMSLIMLALKKTVGNYFDMLIAYGKILLECHSEEPVLFPATKNLTFCPIEKILRHCGAGIERPAPPFLRMT